MQKHDADLTVLFVTLYPHRHKYLATYIKKKTNPATLDLTYIITMTYKLKFIMLISHLLLGFAQMTSDISRQEITMIFT